MPFALLLLSIFCGATIATVISGTVCGKTRDHTFYVSQTIETINGTQYRRVKASGCPGYDWTVLLFHCITIDSLTLFISQEKTLVILLFKTMISTFR